MLDTRKNYEAIFNFVEHWRDVGLMEVNPYGNSNCKAQVSYNSLLGTQKYKTNVTLIRNGYDDGRISLDEIGDLLSEDYHLDFTARIQTVCFSKKTKKLTVKGRSPKMGEYKVVITPIP